MYRDKISERMHSLRKEKKLTQKELVAKLYVTPSTVSKWENGVVVPDAFGVPVPELLG
ncbi:MAG: helix-turn-helix domain-containing protein [Lachnospiraceae bacterium]|nr:helix-turn-helix domain-containing protein [Lachnospiraceae bacterium]